MAGYSGTPLAKKLGIKPGTRLYADNAPDHYAALLEPLPEDVSFAERLTGKIDLVHLFTREAHELVPRLKQYLRAIEPDGIIWVSWPKKAAKVPTNVTEDLVREAALPLGLVDTKVCVVDEVWSGLKLVIRVTNRKKKTT
jgi:hypothetical protein